MARADMDNVANIDDTIIGATTPAAGTFTALSAGTGAFTGSLEVDGSITLENTEALRAKDSGGTARNIIDTNSGDDLLIGNANLDTLALYAGTSNPMIFNAGAVELGRFDSSGNLLLNTANSPTTTKAIISADYSASGTENTGLTIAGRQGGNWYNNGIHALGSSGLVFSTGTTGTNGADASNERMRIDSSGNVVVGGTTAGAASAVTAYADGKLKASTGASGATANSAADEGVFEGSGDAGISILTPNANNSYLFMGSPGDTSGLVLQWDYTNNEASMGARRAGASTILTSDNTVTNLTLSGASGSELGQFAGKVGVKTNSSGYAIDIEENSGSESWQLGVDSVGSLNFYDSDSANWKVKFTDGMPDSSFSIDSSGNVVVGGTSAYALDAATITAGGQLYASRTSANAVELNRSGTDGEIIRLQKAGATVGSIGAAAGNAYYAGTARGWTFGSSNIYPANQVGTKQDNNTDLGHGSYRFDDIYATNATIQTSDRNEKQDIEELSDAEQRVAVACKGLLRKFRWKDAVSEKGDDARIHFGIIAQDLQAAFEAEGLDAGDYAMFTSSTWWETQTEVEAVEAVEGVDFVQAVEASDAIEAVYDEEGELVSEFVEAVEAVEGVEAVEAVEAKDAYTRIDTFETLEEAPEGATKRTRMGVRYSELLAFIIAAL
jgi:hypothetical protein